MGNSAREPRSNRAGSAHAGPAYTSFSFSSPLLVVCTMAASSSNIVFDDMFTLSGIDKEGKKFDRGPRARARPARARR
jgi:hypothetical protein